MNKQLKLNPDGTVKSRGIEWTNFTHNPIRGCLHGCAWEMPDGSIANCYAEDVANKVAQAAYPQGFEHHYWTPDILNDPLKLKTPSKIFVGSMADVFGHWVPTEQIEAVLDVCRQTPQHTYQFLTKNPPRLNRFDFPANCWVGVSAPPSQMMGKPLNAMQQDKWFYTAVRALSRCNATVKWVSFEPLSYDIVDRELCGEHWEYLSETIDWAVIGAASNGREYHQPEPKWLEYLIDWLEGGAGAAIFFKGNLRPSLGIAFPTWREEFPQAKAVRQNLFEV